MRIHIFATLAIILATFTIAAPVPSDKNAPLEPRQFCKRICAPY